MRKFVLAAAIFALFTLPAIADPEREYVKEFKGFAYSIQYCFDQGFVGQEYMTEIHMIDDNFGFNLKKNEVVEVLADVELTINILNSASEDRMKAGCDNLQLFGIENFGVFSYEWNEEVDE